MAALGTFRPGAYAASYNSLPMGLMRSEGLKLKWRPAKQKIEDTSAYGKTLIDGIYQGVTGVQLMATFKEWNTAIASAIWPYGTSPTTFDGTLGGPIGALDSGFAKVVILTPVASTPAVTNTEGSGGILTANLAIAAPENDWEFLFGPVETDVPVLFDLLLYDDSGAKRFFKWS